MNKKLIAIASILDLGEPNNAGKSIADIVLFLMRSIPSDKRPEAIRKMINKLKLLDSAEISGKKMKPYSSMGQSISFIKTILSGHERIYISRVIDSIIRHMVY